MESFFLFFAGLRDFQESSQDESVESAVWDGKVV